VNERQQNNSNGQVELKNWYEALNFYKMTNQSINQSINGSMVVYSGLLFIQSIKRLLPIKACLVWSSGQMWLVDVFFLF
jgi:hypothetical protein